MTKDSNAFILSVEIEFKKGRVNHMEEKGLFRMMGNVVIPEEKLEEMNQLVLTILDKGGIRKKKEIQLMNEKVTVVGKPIPDSEGKVYFDYSIFEKVPFLFLARQNFGWYDTRTGELYADTGNNEEFDLIMSFIMIVQEAYSSEACYLLYKESLCPVYTRAAFVEKMTGKILAFPHREPEYHSPKESYALPVDLYEAIKRKNGKGFLEDENNLSDLVKEYLEDWKEEYREYQADNDNVDIEKELSIILPEMDTMWRCRYVNEELVTEFLEHKEDVNYQAAIKLLKHVVEPDVEFFPELTRRQVTDHIPWYTRDGDEKSKINGLASLLSNRIQRQKIFGF